jgi:hypothetical protein
MTKKTYKGFVILESAYEKTNEAVFGAYSKNILIPLGYESEVAVKTRIDEIVANPKSFRGYPLFSLRQLEGYSRK